MELACLAIKRSLAQCEYIAKMKKVAMPRLTPKQCPDIKMRFV